jgi:hydrophobe/amphiphile efflux-3 (HAE3) family protein
MLEKILHYQIKYSKILLFLMLILIGFSAYIATGIKINPDLGALVDKNSEYNTNDRVMANAFGVNDALLVLVSVDKESIITNGVRDMSSETVILYVDVLKETLTQSPYYVSTTPNQISDSKEILYFVIQLNSPNEIGSFQTVLGELEYLIGEAGAPPGVDVKITGMPVMMDRIAGYLIGDSLNTILITIVFIIIILYLYSRDLVFTLITVATPVSSLIFLGAFMAVLGINITITLAAVGVLVLGLGADYGIHIATHYSAARKEFDTHEEALINTIKDLALPITASFITTLAGFVALTIGISPSSQSQGIVLALAISIIYATSFALFPLLITVFANHVTFKPNVVFDKIMFLLGKLAVIQTIYAKKILWILGIFTVVMVYNASNVEFSNSNSNWIPTDDDVSNSFSEINFAFGQSESITYILTAKSGDLRDANVKRDVDELVTVVLGLPYVDSVSTPYENLEMDSNLIYDNLTGTELGSRYFNQDYTMARITVNSQNPVQDAAGKSILLAELKEIANLNPIYNVDISYFGNAVRFDELTDSLQKDASVTTLTGFALVFLVASLIYASLSVGFLALFPILIAVIWTVGLMSIFSVPFTTLSTGIVSLVLGVGVDFSIHLVDGIKKYLAKGYRIADSIQYTFSTSGKAIILASITTMVGFSALLLAKLLGTQRMGMSLSLSIFAVFIVTFTMVPAIMSLLHKDTNKNSKKLKRYGEIKVSTSKVSTTKVNVGKVSTSINKIK